MFAGDEWGEGVNEVGVVFFEQGGDGAVNEFCLWDFCGVEVGEGFLCLVVEFVFAVGLSDLISVFVVEVFVGDGFEVGEVLDEAGEVAVDHGCFEEEDFFCEFFDEEEAELVVLGCEWGEYLEA